MAKRGNSRQERCRSSSVVVLLGNFEYISSMSNVNSRDGYDALVDTRSPKMAIDYAIMWIKYETCVFGCRSIEIQ